MLVRDVIPDEKNPWTAKEVKEMLDYRYRNNDNVEVRIIPDIESVNYGRGVGYKIQEIKVDKKIEGISGTKCRELIDNQNLEYRSFVHKDISDFLERKYSDGK